jgi:hypothetical protein
MYRGIIKKNKFNLKKINKIKISKALDKFENWFINYGDISYDRMDFWSSKLGITGKSIFYKNKILGAPIAIIGLLSENYFPRIQNLFSKKHREVIGDAHFAMSYMNLYKINGNLDYLKRAEYFLECMKRYSTKGYSGYCWGYNFGWQTYKGYWSSGTPLVTITPYAFWAFKLHFEITNHEESKEIVLSIAKFVLSDLKEIVMPNGTYCASYSPDSEDIVINSNTYRAAVLLEAYQINNDETYKFAAQRNIDFVLSYQGDEGEWYYEAKPKDKNFIDNFHTCFVLRNLFQCYLVNKDERIFNAVVKGYNYYINNLFFKDGRPKHFSKAKYAKLRKYEMYDYAEGIKLGILLKDFIPNAFQKSIDLAIDLVDHFQTEKGHFLTRVTTFGFKHKVPYLRWPQAQLFYSLTKLLKEI